LRQIVDATPIQHTHPSVVISPDMPAFTALQKCQSTLFQPQDPSHNHNHNQALDSWAVRHGPQGSQIHTTATTSSSSSSSSCVALANDEEDTGILVVPAATLRQFVNPTGAGNAFAAAYTALRGSGTSRQQSAALATGVGAVFCEYEHCPPFTWQVIQRVLEASRQVQPKIYKDTILLL
jgi:hypothetical protein